LPKSGRRPRCAPVDPGGAGPRRRDRGDKLIGATHGRYVDFGSLTCRRCWGSAGGETAWRWSVDPRPVVLSPPRYRGCWTRFAIRAVLMAGLACMGAGGSCGSRRSQRGTSYPAARVPGVMTAPGSGWRSDPRRSRHSGVQASRPGICAGRWSPPASSRQPDGRVAISTPPPPQANDGHAGFFCLVEATACLACIATGSQPRRDHVAAGSNLAENPGLNRAPARLGPEAAPRPHPPRRGSVRATGLSVHGGAIAGAELDVGPEGDRGPCCSARAPRRPLPLEYGIWVPATTRAGTFARLQRLIIGVPRWS